jgi:hypothetical protein
MIIRDVFTGKFDLDSQEGQKSSIAFLESLENLSFHLQAKTVKRDYRDKFTKAYKVLYISSNQESC